MHTDFDLIVAGGGPAGSTLANIVAKAGLRVLVIERELFPRFHIGESLLPCDLEVFQTLNLDPKKKGFLYKAGAEFLDERVDGHTRYDFSDALEGTADHAYQVERSVFDHWLLSAAEDAGATVHYTERARTVDVQANSVSITTDNKTYSTRFFVDATGQDALMGRSKNETRQVAQFGLAANFTHFENLDPGIDRELCETARGTIKVLYVDEGWCWVIPLGDKRVSIGLVTRKRGLTSDWVLSEIQNSAFLSRITRGATMVRKPGVLSSFSFHNQRQNGARWATTGDASCFLDPVFSSGVSLGMVASMKLGGELATALQNGNEAQESLLRSHVEHVARSYNVFGTLVNSFYHTGLLHGLFFSKEQDPELRRGLTSMLAGDVYRDDNKFQNMLLSSARRAVTFVPKFDDEQSAPAPTSTL